MLIVALLFPLPLLAMIFLLGWIEERILLMREREETVIRLLEEAEPEEIEERIAAYLAPIVRMNGR
jgi:hypothetical protein